EFSVVHDAAYGRSRGGRNLYEVQVLLAGYFERFVGSQNANLLAFIINHADFPRPNALVCADKAFIDTTLRESILEHEMENYSMGVQRGSPGRVPGPGKKPRPRAVACGSE